MEGLWKRTFRRYRSWALDCWTILWRYSWSLTMFALPIYLYITFLETFSELGEHRFLVLPTRVKRTSGLGAHTVNVFIMALLSAITATRVPFDTRWLPDRNTMIFLKNFRCIARTDGHICVRNSQSRNLIEVKPRMRKQRCLYTIRVQEWRKWSFGCADLLLSGCRCSTSHHSRIPRRSSWNREAIYESGKTECESKHHARSLQCLVWCRTGLADLKIYIQEWGVVKSEELDFSLSFNTHKAAEAWDTRMGLGGFGKNLSFNTDLILTIVSKYFLKNCACTGSFVGLLLLLSWWYGQSSFEQRVNPIAAT